MSDFGVIVHIIAGSIALLAGAIALTSRKGARVHKTTGNAFVIAMVIMAVTGAAMAAAKPERLSVVSGILTLYLVLTSWWTVRRKDTVAGPFEFCTILVAAGCVIADLSFGLQAAAHTTGRLDRFPPAAYFTFAALAGLAAALDLNFILRGRLSGRQRLARHLWRMCVALFIAAASFFLGQRDEFPDSIRTSPLLFVPPLATLAAMFFWVLRLRFAKVYARVSSNCGRLAGTVTRHVLRPRMAEN